MLPAFQSCGIPVTAHDQAQLALDSRHRDVDRTISDYHERNFGCEAQDFKNKTGLDPSYRVFLEDYRKFVEARREWAHETNDESARLLLSDQFQDEPFKTEQNVKQWEKLLLWVSGKDTLQEMAESVEKV